ncbi:MAG: serine/threonine-protein kinase [Opitutaceae bacterium]
MSPPSSRCPRCGLSLMPTEGGPVCAACALAHALAADDQSPAPDLPRRFGDYELLDEVGRGGMGLVFRAQQRSLSRVVALKVLQAGSLEDHDGRQRFHAEAEAAARLQHPNIVAIHEIGEQDGVSYLTMDLVDGPDLARTCDGRPLPVNAAARLARDIARAIQVAHEAGVLHRDLKPSNVLLGSDGRARITDFGLAKCDGATECAQTAAGAMFGSPSYASPEQAAGRHAAISVASDIYGIGAILYHLLTGRAPFVANTALQVLRLVLESDPVAPRALNPEVPHDLETICLKCLQKDPARRYHSAAAVAEDLDRLLAHRPIQAHAPSHFYRAAKYARRNRSMVAAAAAIGLSLAGGLVVAYAGLRRAIEQGRATESARAEAERLNSLVVQDLQPDLERYGRLPVLRRVAEESVGYYERLPPRLRHPQVEARHAAALELLARVRGPGAGDYAGGKTVLAAALRLRERAALAAPADPEAAAAVLRNLSLYSDVAGDSATFRSDEYQSALVKRWRSLRARFPDDRGICAGLARALTDYAVGAEQRYGAPAAVAAAEEAQTLVAELAALRPEDPQLRELSTWNTLVRSQALHATGDQAQAAAASQHELENLTAALAADPGDLALRHLTAQAARSLSYRTWGPQSREAEVLAREHYHLLSTLDPANRRYRSGYAMAHWMESLYWANFDGHTGRARALLARHIALLEPLRSERHVEDIAGHLPKARAFLATWSAREGDRVAATEQLAELRSALAADQQDSSAPASMPLHAQLDLAETGCWIAWNLCDWPELLRQTTAALATCGAAPAAAEISRRHRAAPGAARHRPPGKRAGTRSPVDSR